MFVIGQSDFLGSSSKGAVLPSSLNQQHGLQTHLHLNLPILQRTEWSQKCNLPISQMVSMTPKHIRPSWNSESPFHHIFFPFGWFSLFFSLCPLIIMIPPVWSHCWFPISQLHPALTMAPYYVGCSPASMGILIFAQESEMLPSLAIAFLPLKCPAPDILYLSIKIHLASQCPTENLHPIGCWSL